MLVRNLIRVLLVLSFISAGAILGITSMTGCSGNTDGGNDANQDYTGSEFVATDSNTGTIRLRVNEDTFPVSQTTNFAVEIRDVAGAPVPNIRVSCDTEKGVAIIEPNTGTEMTDMYGNMSGVIGCEAPGSFQMACRMPIGANKREFIGIKCTGDIPAGFTGFPNAGGGGLYGGVAVPDDGEPGGVGTDGLVISGLTLDTVTDSDTSSLDTRQDMCDCEVDEDGGAPTIECESFGDSRLVISMENNTNQDFKLLSYTYTVPNADGANTTFTSKRISLGGRIIDANGGTVDFSTLFTESVTDPTNTESCDNVTSCGSAARLADFASILPVDPGFRNVTVRIRGENEVGDEVTIVGSFSISFDNWDNCSAG